MSSTKKNRKRIRWVWWGKWGGVTLCVLLFALWLASGWVSMTFTWPGRLYEGRRIHVVTGMFLYYPHGVTQSPRIPAEFSAHVTASPFWYWFYTQWNGQPGVPLWLPFLLAALLTWGLFVLDKRRYRPGACTSCGYDLKGNTSGRCPECGAEAASKVA